MSVVGVVLAAGMGARVGADGNKAYLRLAGRSMVAWSVEAVVDTPGVGRVVVVYRAGERDLIATTLATELPAATVEFVEGGVTRHASEWNLLNHLASDIDAGAVDTVLIHDAARPLAGPGLMSTALATARAHGGAIPGVPAHDVVRTTADGLTSAGALVRVQTPQAFRARPLLAAYRSADAEGFEGTDTASCIERFTDVSVHVFDGAATNLKVTFPVDVRIADHLLEAGVRVG
jgi:2-C-methyl-D-erythritol 4-phosphate cytidylyltransferase